MPGRQAEFKAGVLLALAYASALNCPRIHLMAGKIPENLGREDVQGLYVSNLRWAANFAANAGIDVLIEPINTRDIPRFFLNRQDHAHGIIGLVGAPNLKVQMDLITARLSKVTWRRKSDNICPPVLWVTFKSLVRPSGMNPMWVN